MIRFKLDLQGLNNKETISSYLALAFTITDPPNPEENQLMNSGSILANLLGH